MKTTIARYLIESCTIKGQLVLDPFCGSGIVPLEAAVRGRKVIAGDVNPYGVLLTRAKLHAPPSEEHALKRLTRRWEASRVRLVDQDLRRVPRWVRAFFHPETLRDALALRDECVARRDWFLIACLLGILHHQRPGFLSYPSSHLVPYLRDRLFPREQFPDMYDRRDVLIRLQAKVARAYRRPAWGQRHCAQIWHRDSRHLPIGHTVDAVITSPPYMNELDYVRDNRLRLWMLTKTEPTHGDFQRRDREAEFRDLIKGTCLHLSKHMARTSTYAFVIGEVTRGGRRHDSADIISDIFASTRRLKGFRLAEKIDDMIPDIRRARRDLRGTKRETILIFKRG